MTSDVKAAPLPRLISVGGVVALLAIDARLEPGQVEEALMQCGVQPVGNDGDGQLVWSDKAVTAAADVIRLACRGRQAGVDVALLASVIREVLGDAAGPAMERALGRHLGTALDDVDARLDRVIEQGQGLFRQQGENGQRMRDVLQACSALTGELRASNAALKKDVGVLLARFEKQTEVLMQSVAEELDAVRRSLNELAKGMKG